MRSIVINANGSVDPDRELWSGTVSFATTGGTIVLDPDGTQPEKAPFYEVITDTLVGTVGLAPFNFHPKDSVPNHGVSVVTGAPTSVQIHHYGPVADGDGNTSTTPPVRVFEALLILPPGKSHAGTPLCDTSVWTEITDGFDYVVSGRVVTISNDTDSFSTNRAY